MSRTRRAATFGPALWFLIVCAGCEPTAESGSGNGDAESAGATRDAATALADSALEAWLDAAGGLSAWDSVRTARYTVTTVWFDTTGAVERMRPRRVELRKTLSGEQARIERPEAEGLYVQVFTGDTAWAALNGRPLPPDDPAAAEAEYVGRDVFYWLGLPYKLRDPGVRHSAESLEDGGLEVRVAFGPAIGAHPGDRYFYRFLDDDPWPEEVHYVEEGSETRARTWWTDFTRAGPITYVGVRTYRDASGRRTKELRIDDVWINPDLADSLFTAPSGE